MLLPKFLGPDYMCPPSPLSSVKVPFPLFKLTAIISFLTSNFHACLALLLVYLHSAILHSAMLRLIPSVKLRSYYILFNLHIHDCLGLALILLAPSTMFPSLLRSMLNGLHCTCPSNLDQFSTA